MIKRRRGIIKTESTSRFDVAVFYLIDYTRVNTLNKNKITEEGVVLRKT